MSDGASIAVVGLVVAISALVMVILNYSNSQLACGCDDKWTDSKRTPETEKGSLHTGQKPSDSINHNRPVWEVAEKYQNNEYTWMEVKPVPHVYTMSYEDYTIPYEYLDSNGELKGLMLDLVTEACRRAGQQCVHVYLGKSSIPCWDDRVQRGMGLLRKEVDACVTWTNTIERTNVFQFTTPLMALNAWSVYTNDGSNTVDMIRIKKFGYVIGWIASPQCIEDDLGIKLPEENLVVADDLHDLRRKLRNGEISFAILGGEEPEFIKLPTKLKCGTVGGFGIMVRMDSHLPEWFNKAFKEMRDDGTYERMCVGAESTHGAAADCL